MGDLKPSDFLGILHFSDTDGAFVGEDKVIISLIQNEKIVYKQLKKHAKFIFLT